MRVRLALMLLEANDSILRERVGYCSFTMLQFKLAIVLAYSGLDLVSCFYRCPFDSRDASVSVAGPMNGGRHNAVTIS